MRACIQEGFRVRSVRAADAVLARDLTDKSAGAVVRQEQRQKHFCRSSCESAPTTRWPHQYILPAPTRSWSHQYINQDAEQQVCMTSE